jgi:RHS repeat-associated protein
VVTDYRYDGLDRRIAVTKGGVTTWTYYDGTQPVVDYLDNETTAFQIFAAGERLDELYAVWTRGEGARWTLTDHQGTVRRLLDSTGHEVAAFRWDSYGNPLSASGTDPDGAGRFAFAGREWDAATGLYFNRARYYDPDLGRFISVDPLGFDSGESNLYRYARNSPLVYTDPTGTISAVEFAVLEVTSRVVDALEMCDLTKNVYQLWNYVGQNIASAVQGQGPAGGNGGDYLNPSLDNLLPFGCLKSD